MIDVQEPVFASVVFDCDSTLSSIEGIEALCAALPPDRRREVERLKSRYEPDLSPAGLGVSPKMREIARQVALIAASDRTTVLLTGESGTGKGWVARLIHGLSRRAGRRSCR